MTTDDPDYLLPRVKQTLAAWTVTGYPDAPGSRVLADDHGELAVVAPLQPPTERHAHPTRGTCRAVVTAKRGPYRPSGSTTAYGSFMPKVLASAMNREDVCIQFYGSGEPTYAIEDAWVFDARRVANQATERERNAVDSKRARDVTVFDASRAAHGVGLGDWLSRTRSLPGPERDGSTPTTLKAYVGGSA